MQIKKNSASKRKNPNNSGQAGLEPAASRRTTRPNPDVGPLQLSHHRLPKLVKNTIDNQLFCYDVS